MVMPGTGSSVRELHASAVCKNQDMCHVSLSARIATITAGAALCAGAVFGQGRIAARSADLLTLSVGSHDGVRTGMRGDVVKVVGTGATARPSVIASFVVTKVAEQTSEARLEKIEAGFEGDPMVGLPVAFDQRLKRPDAASPSAQATPRPTPASGLPDDPVELLSQGNAAWERQDWEKAEKLYEALLQALPDYPVAVKRAAAAREKVKAARDAEARARGAAEEVARQEALARERGNIPAYREKAKALLDAGAWNAAVEWLKKIQAADPDDSYLASVLRDKRREAEQALADKRYDVAIMSCEAAQRLERGPPGTGRRPSMPTIRASRRD